MPSGLTDIGFVGLGAMGLPMVRRMLAAGFTVHACDVNEAALQAATADGARPCGTPADVAGASDAVFVSLPTPDVVRSVALGDQGIVRGNRAKIYVDLSTTGARVAQEVAAGLSAQGIVALDAPVSGGVVGATNGTLAVMASGDRSAFEAIQPALLAIGKNTTLVGDRVGQGQTLKLVNNLMAAANFAVASECLVMGAKAGLDADTMVDVINKSSGRSFVSEAFVTKSVLERSFDFGFRMELMNKDMRLALEEAEALGTTMMTTTAAKQLYAFAMAHGAVGRDVTSLIKVLEEWGGAVVEGKGAQAKPA